MDLMDCFQLPQHCVVSIIGSGGKTTLLNALAQHNEKQRRLITTTTKMYYPQRDEYDYIWQPDTVKTPLIPGVYLYGQRQMTAMGEKLLPGNLQILEQKLNHFDKVLIEADGAHEHLLKAWADFEPVIFKKTSLTIGVLPISVCGRCLSSDLVHRLPLFLKYGPFSEGQMITPQMLAQVIEHPQGMFGRVSGPKILVLNQVDDFNKIKLAEVLIQHLSASFRATLDKIIISDVKQHWGRVIWNNER